MHNDVDPAEAFGGSLGNGVASVRGRYISRNKTNRLNHIFGSRARGGKNGRGLSELIT
jgi:hypothetical protein